MSLASPKKTFNSTVTKLGNFSYSTNITEVVSSSHKPPPISSPKLLPTITVSNNNNTPNNKTKKNSNNNNLSKLLINNNNTSSFLIITSGLQDFFSSRQLNDEDKEEYLIDFFDNIQRSFINLSQKIKLKFIHFDNFTDESISFYNNKINFKEEEDLITIENFYQKKFITKNILKQLENKKRCLFIDLAHITRYHNNQEGTLIKPNIKFVPDTSHVAASSAAPQKNTKNTKNTKKKNNSNNSNNNSSQTFNINSFYPNYIFSLNPEFILNFIYFMFVEGQIITYYQKILEKKIVLSICEKKYFSSTRVSLVNYNDTAQGNQIICDLVNLDKYYSSLLTSRLIWISNLLQPNDESQVTNTNTFSHKIRLNELSVNNYLVLFTNLSFFLENEERKKKLILLIKNIIKKLEGKKVILYFFDDIANSNWLQYLNDNDINNDITMVNSKINIFVLNQLQLHKFKNHLLVHFNDIIKYYNCPFAFYNTNFKPYIYFGEDITKLLDINSFNAGNICNYSDEFISNFEFFVLIDNGRFLTFICKLLERKIKLSIYNIEMIDFNHKNDENKLLKYNLFLLQKYFMCEFINELIWSQEGFNYQ